MYVFVFVNSNYYKTYEVFIVTAILSNTSRYKNPISLYSIYRDLNSGVFKKENTILSPSS